MKDYYQILGIGRNATADEIKRAYRKLAHQYHPDKQGGNEQKFKEINEAYQILSNKEKKGQYDQFGQVFEGGQSPGGFNFNWAWGGPGRDFDVNMEDLGEIMEEMFGFGRGPKRQNIKRGKDIEVDMVIPLEDTLNEISKDLKLYKLIPCSRCHGSGAEQGTKIEECFTCRGAGEAQEVKRTPFGAFTRTGLCPECKGEGKTPKKKCNVCAGEGRIKSEDQIKIVIPAGIDSNQVIRLDGKGEAGKRGGEPGNLYVRVRIKRHPVFSRQGDDLYAQKTISLTQAALGAEVEIPTLENKTIVLKVPAGTESGKILRISNKGIPHFSGWGKGNLYVELIVKTPKSLNRKQKELLKELQKQGL